MVLSKVDIREEQLLTELKQRGQMDLKENCKVADLPARITVANVRDIYSSVSIGAQVFELSRPKANLSCTHMQAACRACFTDWGLPDILRTDQGSCFLGNMAQTGFPSRFTLWLVGILRLGNNRCQRRLYNQWSS